MKIIRRSLVIKAKGLYHLVIKIEKRLGEATPLSDYLIIWLDNLRDDVRSPRTADYKLRLNLQYHQQDNKDWFLVADCQVKTNWLSPSDRNRVYRSRRFSNLKTTKPKTWWERWFR